jgi:hypothetical protein
MNDRIAEVISGIGEGAEVIIHPGSDVFDDVRVEQR